jgi:RNA polymerase sigma-70 factor (ECF subfamily)
MADDESGGARAALEDEVRALLRSGDAKGAAERAIRGHGPEILGFLTATLRNEADADDIFSLWAERVLRGLPGFAWECSLRTWSYRVARNAAINFRRDARGRRARELPLQDDASIASELAAAVRSETRPYLRTEAKNKLAALRDKLSPEDRDILILRVDKGLAWRDLGRVMLGEAQADEETLHRETQRLRKRFQLLSKRLVALGKEAGLFGDDES